MVFRIEIQIRPIGPQPCTTTRLLKRRIPVAFCSLDSMYQYGTGLDQDTGIQIQITYVEEGGTKAPPLIRI